MRKLPDLQYSIRRIDNKYLQAIAKHNNTSLMCVMTIVTQQTRDMDQMLTNVVPPSTTLAQHWSKIDSMSRVCWEVTSWVCFDKEIY